MDSTTVPHKVIIISAPSGSGKSTIIHHLLKKYPQLHFSISATTRPIRGKEVNGADYYFLSPEDFKKRIAASEFVEWEEVYTDRFYGTLKSELTRIWSLGGVVLFDVDVKGGVNLKKQLGEQALSIYIMPPSLDELKKRLEARGTDSPEDIATRIERAKEELTYTQHFDKTVVNDKLETALTDAEQLVDDWISQQKA